MLEFVDSGLYFGQDKNSSINPLLQVGSFIPGLLYIFVKEKQGQTVHMSEVITDIQTETNEQP